jgi:hypothetical protein
MPRNPNVSSCHASTTRSEVGAVLLGQPHSAGADYAHPGGREEFPSVHAVRSGYPRPAEEVTSRGRDGYGWEAVTTSGHPPGPGRSGSARDPYRRGATEPRVLGGDHRVKQVDPGERGEERWTSGAHDAGRG